MTFFSSFSMSKFITKHFGGIPKKLSDLKWIIRVNPDSPNSFPDAVDYRKVAPGSQPDFVAPVDNRISKNRYFERDVRRNYPKTVVFNAKEIQMLASGELKSIASGDSSTNAPISNLPPMIKNRYQYRPSAPHLDPTGSAANPDFSIKAVA
ncbi:hypothetical protein BC833DRAFT_578592 [Globomyces pollinis-pini]|nr:hypothetical protein BC833DRAFT_578592 [Globomyces pollinis-pini]